MRYARVALVVALLAAGAFAQSTDVTGDWEVTINSPQGVRQIKASFQQTAEKLKGVFRSERGQLGFDGTVTGKEIKFSYTIQFQGGDLPITMTGEVDGDAIKGTADFGGLAQGEWTAKRLSTTASAAPAPAAPAAAGAAPAPADLTGTWQFEVETPNGTGSPVFTFKQEGEKLTGRYKGLFGEADLTGTVKENAVEFSFMVNAQGTDVRVTYKGTLENDAIKGTAVLGEFGTGSFKAARKKD